MVNCCSCNSNCVCKGCICVRNGQRCTNCNPRRLDRCKNLGLPGARPGASSFSASCPTVLFPSKSSSSSSSTSSSAFSSSSQASCLLCAPCSGLGLSLRCNSAGEVAVEGAAAEKGVREGTKEGVKEGKEGVTEGMIEGVKEGVKDLGECKTGSVGSAKASDCDDCDDCGMDRSATQTRTPLSGGKNNDSGRSVINDLPSHLEMSSATFK